LVTATWIFIPLTLQHTSYPTSSPLASLHSSTIYSNPI